MPSGFFFLFPNCNRIYRFFHLRFDILFAINYCFFSSYQSLGYMQNCESQRYMSSSGN
ncbi:unnamed protein product [Brassica oleracea]|uniref:(rape) hypothetical protein n=1 Tax=Brassica napus TaxID=3708 RepID=A0A816L466_BRANA|nr:unnamed protein product [Brassica napus]